VTVDVKPTVYAGKKARLAIKALGAVWDIDTKMWKVPAEAEAEIRKILAEDPQARTPIAKLPKPPADPITEALNAAYDAAQAQLVCVTHALRVRRSELVKAAWGATGHPALDTDLLQFGGWHCAASPTYHCVYSAEDVELADETVSQGDCIFCRQPRERD